MFDELTAAMNEEMARISLVSDPAARERQARQLAAKLVPAFGRTRQLRSVAVVEWLRSSSYRTQVEAAARFGISTSTLRGLIR
jgi:hypothetical protein